MSHRVTLEPVDRSRDRAMLERWLRAPHVARWWGDWRERVDQIMATPPARHALIAVDGAPVGYLRWEPVVADALAAVGLTDIPSDAVDADIFLGEEEWIGEGIGPHALQLLVAELAGGSYSMLGLCTSVDNAIALRAFEKAGFSRLRQFDDPTVGRCWVMAMQLGR